MFPAARFLNSCQLKNVPGVCLTKGTRITDFSGLIVGPHEYPEWGYDHNNKYPDHLSNLRTRASNKRLAKNQDARLFEGVWIYGFWTRQPKAWFKFHVKNKPWKTSIVFPKKKSPFDWSTNLERLVPGSKKQHLLAKQTNVQTPVLACLEGKKKLVHVTPIVLWKPWIVGCSDGLRKPSPAAALAAFWGISASESEVLTSD